jgi:flavodoxin
MKIGMMIHSKTGNSLMVAQLLQERLQSLGHEVTLENLAASNDSERDPANIQLLRVPKTEAYDLLIFGGPVRGGAFSPVLQSFMQKVPSLQGKRVYGYVTHFFPRPSMGGNQALSKLSEICQNKGTELTKKGSIQWINPFIRQTRINELVENFVSDLS